MLEAGDVIDLVAPASPITKSEYEKSVDFVKSLGLEPRVPRFSDLISSEHAFLSNSDKYRFEHLKDALTNTESKAIWCLTGGYGSQRLLSMLDSMNKPLKQKSFIGFSDITILHNYFYKKWQFTGIYGPMLTQIVKSKHSKKSIELLKNIIFGNESNLVVKDSVLIGDKPKQELISGVLIGGCASLIQSLIGTKYAPDFSNKILVLEDDRYEGPHRLDRIFDHIEKAGCFDNLSAVILGNLLETKKNAQKLQKPLKKALSNLSFALNKRGVPLLQNFKIGHAYNMQPIIIGAQAKIKFIGDLEIEIDL